MGHKSEKDKTERVAGLGRRTRGDIEKWDQTENPEIPDRRDINPPASLRERSEYEVGSGFDSHRWVHATLSFARGLVREECWPGLVCVCLRTRGTAVVCPLFLLFQTVPLYCPLDVRVWADFGVPVSLYDEGAFKMR